ncbi:hypothetical protein ACFL54_04465 [Planctomycetota bacterium]
MPEQQKETTLPNWAQRLKKKQIARLYATIGRGIIDEELIDDVGYSLLARCESILEASEASWGRVKCPQCGCLVEHSCRNEEVLCCSACDWSCSWLRYKKTFQRKQLFVGGMEPFYREFVVDFRKARSARQRLIIIDTMIHRFHWEYAGHLTRPGATNLIEGREASVIAFLDQLSYGAMIPPEIASMRALWREKVKLTKRN